MISNISEVFPLCSHPRPGGGVVGKKNKLKLFSARGSISIRVKLNLNGHLSITSSLNWLKMYQKY